MASRITPNRNEISASFRSASFRVRTDVMPAWIEIALATDPALFAGSAMGTRTRETFASTREVGPIPVPAGDAIWIVPEDVLERFVGQPRLYYALAVFASPDRKNPQIVQVAPEAAASIAISRSFTGARRRLSLTGARSARPGGGYGATAVDDRSLQWAGDEATPGTETISPPAAAPSNGMPAATAPPPAAAAQAFVYKDGLEHAYGPVPEEETADEVADAEAGIDGPLPDEDAAVVQALDTQQPEDPYSSRFVSAHSGNYRARAASRGPRTIERIVIHITDGGSKLSGTVSWFQNPAAKVSSHYIVGRDGEIVQMVRHNDVAWHAHTANGTSIGIEHNANTKGLNPTEPQYRASARLVAWLCAQYGIPCDRDHVLGHSEADPTTTHTGCPNAVWDWEVYMQMLSEESAALTAVQSNGAATQSYVRPLAAIDVRWDDVEPVYQPTGASCWAAAAAMVVGWRDRISIDPEQFARHEGRWSEYDETGLYTNDNDEFARAWMLMIEPPQNYTVEGFAALLRDNGPLWVGRVVGGSSGHAVAVYGISGDGTVDGTEVLWHDPSPPGTGTPNCRATYRVFMTEFEDFISTDPSGRVNNQILHGNGRRPVSTSQGIARQLDAVDVEWADVEPVYQPTGVSCWAAAAAMVVGFRDRISINPDEFAKLEGRWSEYNKTGLYTNNNDEFATAWGLHVEPPQSYSIEGFATVLANNGPLWVGRLIGGSSGHAVCVYGIRGDGTPTGTQVLFHDPWPPGTGTPSRSISYAQFTQEYEDFITTDPSGRVNNQILHAGGTDGRQPNTSYAYGLEAQSRTQVAPLIAAAAVEIGGILIQKIIENEGDIRGTFVQWPGMKHPRGVDATTTPPVFQTSTIRVSGRKVEAVGVDEIWADCELSYQYNGRSLGNVRSTMLETNDAVGLGLIIEAELMEDANSYVKPGSADNFAALNVRFKYHFELPWPQDDIYAITDYVIYGDGTHTEQFRWTS